MSGEIARLFVSIGAQTKEFQEGMKGVQSRMKSIGAGVTKAGGALTKGITLPAIAAGGALFGLAQKTANAGDEIQKMALRTGLSTEAISELKHAAELSGTSIEAMETGVKRMQKVLYDAEKGLASSNDALAALNLSFEDMQGLSPEDQFNKLAGALADVEDPSRRAALAQEVFGRAGTQMLPMLAEGSAGLEAMRKEAHELGIVFDQEAADAAAKFNDDMLRLKKGFTGAFQELAMKLIPIFVDDFIPLLQAHIIPLVHSLVQGIINLIQWFSGLEPVWQQVVAIAGAFFIALGPILLVVGKLIALFGTLAPLFGIIKAGLLILTGPVGIVIAIVVGLIAIWKKWGSEIKVIVDNVVKFIKNMVAGIAGAVKNVSSTITSPFRKAQKAISGIMDKAKTALNKLNPFSRSSPSLVDNVKRGMGIIEDEVNAVSGGIDVSPIAHQVEGGSMNHTGKITIEGVNSEGEFQGSVDIVVEQMIDAISTGDRRVPNRTSLVPG